MYLHIKVEHVLKVDKLNTLTDLSHKNGTGSLCQNKVIVNDSLEEFTSFDPASIII